MDRAQDIAYMAGMIDADGHICWRGDKWKHIALGVTNTSKPLMNWLEQNLGGSVSLQRGVCSVPCPDKSKPGHYCRKTEIYKWHIVGERAAIMVRVLLPYLKIKPDKAYIALQQLEEAYSQLQRPARRDHHIKKETEAMRSLGWID